jgi:hypothetical protein
VQKKMGVKMLHQFRSGLEHTFLWVVDAENAHIIQELMERTAGRINTVKIVPLITFQELVERCEQIEEGSFFKENRPKIASHELQVVGDEDYFLLCSSVYLYHVTGRSTTCNATILD